MTFKKFIAFICIILNISFLATFAFANGSAREFRNDFRQAPGIPDAEYLDIGDVSFRTELLLEAIFNKRGDWWYTVPTGMNNFFRYDSTDKSLQDQDWKDRWGQTLFLDVAFRPTEWFSAQFGLEFILDYASRYWTTVNHPHRMFDSSTIIPKFSWNTAKAEVHNDWMKLAYYRNQSHYNWQYEGDMFNIYQKQPDAYNDLRVTGRPVPEWWQFNTSGSFGDVEIQYGEPMVDYKQGIYLKYKNIFGSNFNFLYADHIIPYGYPEERMRTAEVSTDFNIAGNTLQLGAKFRPFRTGDKYQYQDGTVGYGEGYNGTNYVIKEKRTNYGDAFGGGVSLSMPKTLGVDMFTLKYVYEGLSAGNKHQINAGVQQKVTNTLTGALDYMYRRPIIDALPASASSYGPDLITARGKNSPFWVWWRNEPTGWDNRHTSEFVLTFTYDPTPDTWFYQYEPNTIEDWNLNPQEDALLTFATQVRLTRYLGRTDRQIYRDVDANVVWENFSGYPVYGALGTDSYLGSWLFLTRMFLDDVEIIYDFEVGEDVATMSAPYTHQESFLKEITGYFKTNLSVNVKPYKVKLGYGKDVWGNEDWNREFGATFDEYYYAQISRDFTKCLTVGVDYVGVRKTDPIIVKSIDGVKDSRNEIGTFDEVRVFVRHIFDVLLKFKTAERVEKDDTPPTVQLSLDPDVIMPSKGQKTTLYPMAEDENGIATWTIKLLDATQTVVYAFSGHGYPPESVDWNGKDFENRYLPDATYDAQLIVTDTFGNVGKSNICQVKLITPELRVIQTDRGLKLSFSSKVLFDFDKTNIKPSADKVLKEAVRILNSYVKYDLSVEGHTDSYGSYEYNQGLSERRAKAVANYLIKAGIDRKRISTVGHGETQPIATNRTSAGRDQNRRVEILILQEKEKKVGKIEYDLRKK